VTKLLEGTLDCKLYINNKALIYLVDSAIKKAGLTGPGFGACGLVSQKMT
jgi:hypothetical protein